MASEIDISIDRQHYNCIIETANDVKHLTKAVGDLATKVDSIATRMAACPCPAVKDLQSDVETLQIASADLKGRVAVAVGILGIVAGWIGSLIPELVGRA